MHSNHVTLFEAGVRVLCLDGWLNRVHIATQACHRYGDGKRRAARGIYGVINRVVRERRSQLAGPNAVQRVGSPSVLKIEKAEILVGGTCQWLDIGHIVTVSEADARKTTADRILRECRCAVAV